MSWPLGGGSAVSDVELSFTAPFGVVLRAFRRAAGWTQVQLAVELHRDHTYVSKWENGTLRPDAADVDGLASALPMRPQEQAVLRDAWVRSGDDVGASPPSEDDLLVSLQAASALRRLGQPRLAYELAGRDGRAALHRARTSRLSDERLRSVLGVAGDLLLEEVKSALDFATNDEVRGGLLRWNAREHRLVSATVDDRQSRLGMAVAEEAVQYAMGDIEGAHRTAQLLLGELTASEPEWLAETIRAVAINSGLLGDDGGLAGAWRRFLDIEPELDENLRRFALEGFMRGYTTVLPDRAFEIVDTSYRSLETEGSVSAVRRVQLARSEGRLVAHVSGTVGDGETRRRVEQALATSRALELDKYVGELERLLD